MNEASDDQLQPVPFCTIEERVERLQKKCGQFTETIDRLSRKTQREVYAHTFVDMKHKVLACLPPKSGCTTWKTILANNSGDHPLPPHFKMMQLHFGDTLKDLGIRRLRSYNISLRAHFIKNYFKFMVVRHPLERFRSAYIDKLQSGSDITAQRHLGSLILQKYRPYMNPDRIATGQGVTIEEFVRFINETHTKNRHWDSLIDLCQPCAIKYDRILKTETLDHDNVFLIDDYMKPYGRGIGTKGNSVAGGPQIMSLSPLGRRLEIYGNLSFNYITVLQKMYRIDMDYFGYSWRFSDWNGTYSYRSSCVNGSLNRTCC